MILNPFRYPKKDCKITSFFPINQWVTEKKSVLALKAGTKVEIKYRKPLIFRQQILGFSL